MLRFWELPTGRYTSDPGRNDIPLESQTPAFLAVHFDQSWLSKKRPKSTTVSIAMPGPGLPSIESSLLIVSSPSSIL